MAGLLTVIGGHLGLNWWNGVWSIIGGVVAALIFVGAIARGVTAWLRRPRLVLECGYGPEYDRRIATSSPDIAHFAGAEDIHAAFGKTLTVREVNGGLAREVVVRVIEVRTPGEAAKDLPYPLTWMHGGEEQDIQPRGHKRVYLQRMILTSAPGGAVTTHVQSPVDGSSPQDITVEVLVAGRRRLKKHLRIENAWPGLLGLVDIDPQALPAPFPFPSVRLVDRQAT